MDPDVFAREWIDAWNAHDLERILRHYAEDVVFESPGVRQLMNDPSGRVVGKAALRAYFAKGLARMPDLHFELRDVLVGVSGCAIRFWSKLAAGEVIEVLRFGPDGLVVSGEAYRAKPEVRRA
jgi:ketosteroid isomerase-like protein